MRRGLCPGGTSCADEWQLALWASALCLAALSVSFLGLAPAFSSRTLCRSSDSDQGTASHNRLMGNQPPVVGNLEAEMSGTQEAIENVA